MNQSQRYQKGTWFPMMMLAVLTVAAVLFSLKQFMDQEVFQWIVKQVQFKTMMAELSALFIIFSFFGILLPRNWQKLLVCTLALSVFLWAHRAFLAVLVSGLYLIYGSALGRVLRVHLWSLPKQDGLAADFITGFSFSVVVYCLLSAIGIGGIFYLDAFVLITGAALILRAKPFGKKKRAVNSSGRKPVLSFSVKEVLLLSFILTMICIQAGRLNITVDYDSLWYGVRSQYVLNNGHGIYENLGTIGIVYTYSKGLEVFTLPLAKLPSYGFLISINLWLACGVIYMSYKVGRFYLKREQALFLAALVSAVPGIMNMAVAAKSDIMTLFVQVIMLYYLIQYLYSEGKAWRNLIYALSAFFLSWTLKPTAMVFSTAVLGMAFIFFLWKGIFPRIFKERGNGGSIGILLFSLLALAGIWARTMLLTGLPVTSVFSSLLVKLGFELKYPFMENSIPNSGNGLTIGEQASRFLIRLFRFLLRPMGVDMEHVLIAWGGFMLVFLIFLWIMCWFYGKNVDKGVKNQLFVFLNVIYGPFLLVNIVSLAMLTQVDGNYFMLLYVFTILMVLKAVAATERKTVWRGAVGASLCLLLFSVFVTAVTNWNWTLGFTPVSFKHKGYYDHYEENRLIMEEMGNEEIWSVLSENPENRVIAVGQHPTALRFPCNIQSYEDIAGVWGNVSLVKTMDRFLEFLDYARTNYIYAQAGYMQEGYRSYELVKDLIESGKLVIVCLENGNLLARVELNGEYSEASAQALTDFLEGYIKKEPDET